MMTDNQVLFTVDAVAELLSVTPALDFGAEDRHGEIRSSCANPIRRSAAVNPKWVTAYSRANEFT